jgi:hypothetical protein
MTRCIAFAFVGILSVGLTCAVQAGPVAAGGVGKVAATERPYTLEQAGGVMKLGSFGLCDAPQNADDLPTQPVPQQEDACNFYQRFEATSVGPSHGGSCGGYTVAFGPMGDLKLNWKRYRLNATWGDTPLTQAQCSKARLSAVAWGARCLNDACTSTQWEKLGGPASKQGTWGANQSRCYLEHQFGNGEHHYKTLNIDIIASLQEGSQTVRKRAHAVIRAERGNGKCASTTQGPPPPPPVQAASTAGATYQPRQKP